MWSEGERERSDEKIVMAESHMQLAKRDVSEVRLRVQIGLSGILHTKCFSRFAKSLLNQAYFNAVAKRHFSNRVYAPMTRSNNVYVCESSIV